MGVDRHKKAVERRREVDGQTGAFAASFPTRIGDAELLVGRKLSGYLNGKSHQGRHPLPSAILMLRKGLVRNLVKMPMVPRIQELRQDTHRLHDIRRK